MTLTEAKALHYGQSIWFVANDGSARRVKVNGAPKTWKRSPDRVQVPVKYGMYEYATFTEYDIASGRLLVEKSSMATNPTRRKRGHTSNLSPIRFHGAFSSQADADAKAEKVGGIVKTIHVRGQRRYSVVTAA